MSDLAEKAYLQLKNDLMDDVFPLGEMIIEQNLVDRYGMSRTPIREAATRLVHEGYLKKYPKKGYTIRCTGEQELRELLECRYILECGVVERIIERATDEEIRELGNYMKESDSIHVSLVNRSLAFHLNMAKLVGNASLYQMLQSILYHIVRPLASSQRVGIEQYISHAADEGYREREHDELLEAMLNRDLSAAKKILKQDISGIAPF